MSDNTTFTRDTIIRSRQAELVDHKILVEPITIIGCGAIGSFTALTLAKMGFHNLFVWDSDQVSPENISNQFYKYNHIGLNKACALSAMIEDFENIRISPYACNWSRIEPLYPTVIMAVDSMKARHDIYKAIKGKSSIKRFIDGRMGGQQAEVHAYNNNRIECPIYEKYLWTDEEASELRCTQKAVMYNVLWIASHIANTLRLMLEDKPFQRLTYMDFENQVQQSIEVI